MKGCFTVVPITLGTNIASLRTVRNLSQLDESQRRAFQRLSSGMRIERASDDAAGLSVVASLNARSRILARANQNLSDGQSVLSIADEALGQVSSVVTRLAELAQQAANGTFSSAQRNTLDQEYKLLSSEIIRVARSTTFNGLNLLQGTLAARAKQTIVVGSGDTLNGVSVDARFQVLTDSSAGTGTLISIRDSLTGEIRQLADPTNGGSLSADAKVLANGDLVFSYEDGVTFAYKLAYYSYANQTITELGSSSSDAFANLTVSADGSTVAFMSTANFTDGGTTLSATGTTGAYKIWTYNLNTHAVRGTNNNLGNISGITISNNGQYVLANSAVGLGLIVANFSRSGTVTAAALSATNNLSSAFGVTDDGRAIFYSNSNTTGQNPTAQGQFFSYNFATGAYTQLSNFTSATTGLLQSCTMSTDGYSVYFTTANDFTGGGYSRQNTQLKRQVFAYDLTSLGLRQLTNYQSNLLTTTSIISKDGSRIFNASTSGLGEFDITADTTNIDFEAGYGSSGNIIASLSAALSSVRGLGSFTLQNTLLARAALDRMQDNLSLLSQARGVLGASQSRLTIAGDLAASQRDEAKSAAARISDIDTAQEAANLIRTNIAKQSAVAILAQANQQPALVLTLLR